MLLTGVRCQNVVSIRIMHENVKHSLVGWKDRLSPFKPEPKAEADLWLVRRIVKVLNYCKRKIAAKNCKNNVEQLRKHKFVRRINPDEMSEVPPDRIST